MRGTCAMRSKLPSNGAAPHVLMCGFLSVQRALSGALSSRRFLLRPPEPSPDLLVSSPSGSIYIGKTKFLRVPFFWNPEKLINPHLCVLGTTGSGKSYFVKTFITRARLVMGTSAIILDWAGEYADWAQSAGGSVLSFGKAGINLLDPGEAPPHARAKQVADSLEILTDLSAFPSQKALTLEAIEKAYLRRGYSLSKPGQARRRPPTLQHVHALLAKAGRKNQEARACAARINDLLLSSGDSFTKPTLRTGDFFKGLVCIDLHSLPTEPLRSLAGLAVLQIVKERMRQEERQGSKKPSLFVVVDEAWKIASDERSDVISIVREGRKYGFGLVVASQNPSDVHRSVFANSGTVVCFRITSAPERDYVRSSLSYSDFFEAESHGLSVGQALLHLEFARPVPCPKTFLLGMVDGEDLLKIYSISGDGMEMDFERNELARRLSLFGLSDRQGRAVLAEFEKRNYSMGAAEFVILLERLGHSRPAVVSFLRALGAREREILAVISASGSRSQQGKQALIELADSVPETKPRRSGATIRNRRRVRQGIPSRARKAKRRAR